LYNLNNKELTTLRTSEFILSLLSAFNTQIDYCLVRGGIKDLNPLTSDVDIIINKKDYYFFYNLLEIKQEELNFKIINTIKRQYVYTHILYLVDDKVFTQIDTEFNFDWRGFVIMNSSTILNRKILNNEGVFVAESKDISIMKLYRSLFWGQRISKKYASQNIVFDKKYLETNSSIELESNQIVSKLIEYYSTETKSKVKMLRKKLIKANFKLNKIKTVLKFLDFFLTEIKLFRSNNGVRLFISGEESLKLDFTNKLKEYIDFFNAPFKSHIIETNLNYVQKRKKMRDSFVIFMTSPNKSDYKIDVAENEIFILDNTQKKISFSNQNINEIINYIYK
tara:strand:- start:4049 stop:5059 length:1011 start_codon:yes stop_codon:yes gene_type:complete